MFDLLGIHVGPVTGNPLRSMNGNDFANNKRFAVNQKKFTANAAAAILYWLKEVLTTTLSCNFNRIMIDLILLEKKSSTICALTHKPKHAPF